MRLNNPARERSPAKVLGSITPDRVSRIAEAWHGYRRALQQQHQRDTEIVASLVRVLSDPRGVARAEVKALRDIIREIAREEMSRA